MLLVSQHAEQACVQPARLIDAGQQSGFLPGQICAADSFSMAHLPLGDVLWDPDNSPRLGAPVDGLFDPPLRIGGQLEPTLDLKLVQCPAQG